MKVTSHKASNNRVGGGTTNIGAGSGDIRPPISPDWDVKWPDGDAKNEFIGV